MNYVTIRDSDQGSALTLLPLLTVKEYLKVTYTSEDTTITNLISQVINDMEGFMWQSLIASTYKAYTDGFRNGCIDLVRGPVNEITSVEYYDSANALQTWADTNYFLSRAIPDKIIINDNTTPPATYNRPDAIIVTYTTDPTPEAKVKSRALQGIGYLFQNRNSLDMGMNEIYKAIVSGSRRNHF